MHEPEKQNSVLIAEANKILRGYELLRILEKYGTPFVTGSYALKLMTRRDLDINLNTAGITEKRFFQMGGEITSALKPRRVDFLNEFVHRHPRLPLGLYFGITTAILGVAHEWNIDIWALDAEQVRRNKKAIAELQSAIDDNKRALILEIKSRSLEHPGYQHSFFSMDIYKAVITDGLTTADEFFQWVEDNRNTDLTI
ncbi:MAG: hypothetical protein A2Y90_01850 [Chloroflexi bacterium RBG_13_52_12]|nr:MAG: hypothetical protein A2Y90_01850 [Chloroflexi bacterium RBG_13_52_12]